MARPPVKELETMSHYPRGLLVAKEYATSRCYTKLPNAINSKLVVDEEATRFGDFTRIFYIAVTSMKFCVLTG